MKNAALVLLLAILVAGCAEQQPPQPVVTPTVTPLVTPSETDQDLRELPPSPQWKPGDPVREMGDLRQSLVTPAVFEGDLRTLWPANAPCSADAQPPDARYDRAANRWLASRRAPGSHFCVALTRSGDPVNGGWYVYDFSLPIDRAGAALEISENAYLFAMDLGGTRMVFAFERLRMLEGAPTVYTRMPPGATGPP
jgi:hypothetical protein